MATRYTLRPRSQQGKVISFDELSPEKQKELEAELVELNDFEDLDEDTASINDDEAERRNRFIIEDDMQSNFEMLLDGWHSNLTKEEIAKYEPLINKVKDKAINFSKILRANLLESDKENALEQFLVIKQMLEDENINLDYFALQNHLSKKIELNSKYTEDQLLRYKQKEEELGKKIENNEMRFQILDLDIDERPKTEILKRFHHLEQLTSGEDEYAKTHEWITYAMRLPWNKYTPLPVTHESTKEEKFKFVKDTLEKWNKKQAYVENAKEEMLLTLMDQFSCNDAKNKQRSKIIALHGAPGLGKSLFMKNMAEILGLGIYWIDFSGASDPTMIRGHRYTYTGAEPGKIIKGAISIGAMNGIFVLEEIDKIVQSFGSENKVENVLISLLDRTRDDWIDDYLDFPFDISGYTFVTTINDKNALSAPLLNRLHIIEFPKYKLEEKHHIAKAFEIPKALSSRGLESDQLIIPDSTIRYIISKIEQEGGVRNLKRAIESVIQRANFYIQTGGLTDPANGTIDVQFKIDDFQMPFVVKEKHVDAFLKHMEPSDQNWKKIYM